MAHAQTIPQLEGAHEYLKKLGDAALNVKDLEESAGVGVVVSSMRVRPSVLGGGLLLHALLSV